MSEINYNILMETIMRLITQVYGEDKITYQFEHGCFCQISSSDLFSDGIHLPWSRVSSIDNLTYKNQIEINVDVSFFFFSKMMNSYWGFSSAGQTSSWQA